MAPNWDSNILSLIKEQTVGVFVNIAGGGETNEQEQLYSSPVSAPPFGKCRTNMGSWYWTRWVFQFDPSRSYF